MIASRSFLKEAKASLLLGKTLGEDRLVSDEPASQPDNLFHVVKLSFNLGFCFIYANFAMDNQRVFKS